MAHEGTMHIGVHCSKQRTGMSASRRDRRMRLASWISAALFCVLLWAQDARAQFTRFENLTDEQGLGNMTVTAFAQDRDGFILIGTEAGLFRFNGTSVARADGGIPSGTWIRRISVDAEGQVWAITAAGLFLRSGAVFRRVDLPGSMPGSPRQLAFGGNGLVVIRGGQLLHATLHDGVVGPLVPVRGAGASVSDARSVTAAGSAGFLVGCGSGLCRLAPDGAVERYGIADGLPSARWEAATRTADGTFWVRSLNRLAWRHPGAPFFSTVDIPGRDQRFFSLVPDRLAIVSDSRGGIVTQGDQGLLRWDGAAWHAITHHAGGLAAGPVQALMLDREKSLWVGSLGHGAFRSVGLGTWESWTADDGLTSDMIWAVTRRSDGRLWVATYVDALPLDQRSSSVPGGSENVAATGGSRLWLSPLGAPLARLDEAGRLERFAAPRSVFSIVVDGRNRLLVCSGDGLLTAPDADEAAASLHLTTSLALPTYAVTTDLGGAVWALAAGSIYREAAAGRFDKVAAVDDAAGMTALEFAGPDELWVATGDRGVLRYRIRGMRAESLPSLGPPFLASRDIVFLHRDRHARMWIGTDNGVDMWSNGRFRHLGAADGLISNDLDQGAVFEDTDSSMWFGTSHGLSHLLALDDVRPTTSLHPHLTGVSLGTRDFGSEPNHVSFQSSATPLTIRFADLDYAVTRPVRFRYRMRGLDTGWNETVGHEVRYAGLPPGRFRFEMFADDAAHALQSAPIGFELKVTAPWWRRWWFYAAVALGIGGLVVLAWQLRVRLLMRQQQRLASMVAARTAEIEQAREELHLLALSDAMTGLPNRRAFLTVLDQAVTRAAADGSKLGVLLCDIDHFKRINDGFGHVAGDGVLAAFGARLRDAINLPDAAGRYGGEEFCVLLHGSRAEIEAKVEAIRAATSAAPYRLGGETDGVVTSSGGLAFLRTGDTALLLLARADAALYDAKENGRNRIERERDGAAAHGKAARVSSRAAGFDGLLDPAEIALRDDLETAMRENQFSLHFQPVVDISQDKVTSCEALIRWHSPTRGRVPPVEFIPFAEQIGLMPAMGDWILHAACREAMTWPERLVVSVNLSPEQLRLPDLLARLDVALATTGLAAHRLELEITETAMIEDAEAARTTLDAIRARGIKIALDDFGTGYSSLSFLRTLPFDRVKIDRSFVQDLDTKPEAAVIVRGIVDMSRNLGAAVTAEGVETDEQIALLRAAGAFELQGYRLARPCPAADLHGWIAAFEAKRGPRDAVKSLADATA